MEHPGLYEVPPPNSDEEEDPANPKIHHHTHQHHHNKAAHDAPDTSSSSSDGDGSDSDGSTDSGSGDSWSSSESSAPDAGMVAFDKPAKFKKRGPRQPPALALLHADVLEASPHWLSRREGGHDLHRQSLPSLFRPPALHRLPLGHPNHPNNAMHLDWTRKRPIQRRVTPCVAVCKSMLQDNVHNITFRCCLCMCV